MATGTVNVDALSAQAKKRRPRDVFTWHQAASSDLFHLKRNLLFSREDRGRNLRQIKTKGYSVYQSFLFPSNLNLPKESR